MSLNKQLNMSAEGKEIMSTMKSHKLVGVQLQVMALEDGYYAPAHDHNSARIVKTGETFMYDGLIKDGKLPLWVRPIDMKKAKAAGVLVDKYVDEDELEEAPAKGKGAKGADALI